jgi:hypothetical protein
MPISTQQMSHYNHHAYLNVISEAVLKHGSDGRREQSLGLALDAGRRLQVHGLVTLRVDLWWRWWVAGGRQQQQKEYCVLIKKRRNKKE